MKKAGKMIAAAGCALMCSPVYTAYAASPATGNTESKTYVWVLAAAGVLVVIAAAAGIFTKKKK